MHNKSIQMLTILCLLLFVLSCKKSSDNTNSDISQIVMARSFVNTLSSSLLAPARELVWDKSRITTVGNNKAIWVPLHYSKPEFIWHSLDSSRLFNTNFLQTAKLWQDSLSVWHAELVTYFPDSLYMGGKVFTGIILIRNWQDKFIASYKISKDGLVQSLAKKENVTTPSRVHQNQDWLEVCYTSSGYNYANMTREVYYWEIDLGCSSFYVGGGSDGYGYSAGLTFSDWYQGGGGTSSDDAQWINVKPIKGAPNAIADIKDYNKCFDNIAGSGHQYSVTICIDQPKPGMRDPWGLVSSYPNNDYQFMNVGHAFLVLKDFRGTETITRNVGFYPQSSVSPISPVDKGQLNNDEEHFYNISLTIPLDNSSFFTVLDYVSHGNDSNNQYDLNSNNCTTFVINALNRAGIRIPATVGYWSGGGGYNPGDLGEDIRTMPLSPGMTRSLNDVAHPNTGKCN